MSLLLLLFATAAAPVPTKAQSDLSPAETRKLLEEYGVCIVKWRRAQASEAILRNVNNGELMRRYPRLVDGSCLPMRPASVMKVKFVGDQFRYALADALVRSELAALPAPSLDMVPALDHRDPTAPSRLSPKGKPLSEKAFAAALQSYDEAKAFSFLSRYGECVVRVNPAAARVLLLTKPEIGRGTSGIRRDEPGIRHVPAGKCDDELRQDRPSRHGGDELLPAGEGGRGCPRQGQMSMTMILIIVAVVAVFALLALRGGGGPRVTTIERRTERKKDADDA